MFILMPSEGLYRLEQRSKSELAGITMESAWMKRIKVSQRK